MTRESKFRCRTDVRSQGQPRTVPEFQDCFEFPLTEDIDLSDFDGSGCCHSAYETSVTAEPRTPVEVSQGVPGCPSLMCHVNTRGRPCACKNPTFSLRLPFPAFGSQGNRCFLGERSVNLFLEVLRPGRPLSET